MNTASPLRIAQSVALDQTSSSDYERLVEEELAHFSEITVTEGLTEGGMHAHQSWCFYFEYLYGVHFKLSFYDAVLKATEGKTSPRVLSLGCGYGGHDLEIARKLTKPCELLAVDLNPRIFDSAMRRSHCRRAADQLPVAGSQSR